MLPPTAAVNGPATTTLPSVATDRPTPSCWPSDDVSVALGGGAPVQIPVGEVNTNAAPRPPATPVAPATIVLASSEIATAWPKKSFVLRVGRQQDRVGVVVVGEAPRRLLEDPRFAEEREGSAPNGAPATIVLPLPDIATENPS